jgi:hypothetical protein
MSFISSVDVGTLLGCQIVLTLVYAIVFCCMKVIYPYLRGAGSVTLAFFAATIANVLLLLSGSIPAFLSVVVAHCLLLCAFVLFYTGVLHFFKSPRRIRYAWVLTTIASALTGYLVLSHNHPLALTYVIAISFFLVRGVIAVEIFRQAADRIFLKIFAYLMAGYAIFALNRVFFLLVYGVMPNREQREVLQTVSVLLSVSLTSRNAICSAASSTAAVSSRSSTPNSSVPAAAPRASPSPSSTSTTSKPSTTTPDTQLATPPSATSSLPSPGGFADTICSAASAATNFSSSCPTPPVQTHSLSPLGSSSRCRSFPSRAQECLSPSVSASPRPPPAKSPAHSSPAPTRPSITPRTRAATAAVSSSTRKTPKRIWEDASSFPQAGAISCRDSACPPSLLSFRSQRI